MRALRECRLYGIIDLSYIPRLRDCNRVAEQMVTGGVDLIQLRGKEKSIGELIKLASEIHEITAGSGTPLIVNDHAEIAARAPVEGVHVGGPHPIRRGNNDPMGEVVGVRQSLSIHRRRKRPQPRRQAASRLGLRPRSK